jgi:tetratricopeptide (TPR) repeat protein
VYFKWKRENVSQRNYREKGRGKIMIKKIFYIFLLLTINLFVFGVDNTPDAQPKRTLNGYELWSAGKYKESIQTLDAEKKQFPDRSNIYVILAWDYRDLRDFVSMENISLEGLKAFPNDSRIFRNLAEAYHFQKKYVESAATFEKFLKFKNGWSDQYIPYAYYYLGVSYFYLNQNRKADVALSTANHFIPKNYNTLILLAEIKEKLGDFKMSFNLFTQANQIQPNTQRALDGIARTKNK